MTCISLIGLSLNSTVDQFWIECFVNSWLKPFWSLFLLLHLIDLGILSLGLVPDLPIPAPWGAGRGMGIPNIVVEQGCTHTKIISRFSNPKQCARPRIRLSPTNSDLISWVPYFVMNWCFVFVNLIPTCPKPIVTRETISNFRLFDRFSKAH